jgi:hypothetical protein
MIPDLHIELNERPALARLVAAMERRLSQRQRIDIARHGRKAKAAKQPWVRGLTRDVTAEIRRLAAQQAAE